MKWLNEGDKNTKFFHVSTKGKIRKNYISRIKNSHGILTNNHEEMGQEAVNYFQHILSSEGAPQDLELLQVIPNLVNNEDNEMLIRLPDVEEVKNTVFGMSILKAGPDGYSGIFFHRCWEIIEKDLMDLVTCFFNQGQIPRAFNFTLLVLIPK